MDLMRALFCALIWIVFFPVWLIAVILYEAQAILLSRKLGVSRTDVLDFKRAAREGYPGQAHENVRFIVARASERGPLSTVTA